MANPSPAAKKIAEEIIKIAAANTNVADAFGGDPSFRQTVQEILDRDQAFEQQGGIFFHTGSNSFETADTFTKIHMEQYRKTGRPSLPALAVHHAEIMGLDQNGPEYRALIMVAARAEIARAVMPDYHNQYHYMDVAAVAANLVVKHNEMAAAGTPGVTPLTKEQQAWVFIAAMGHDIDHPGGSNPPGQPLFLEETSYSTIEPLLREAGLSHTGLTTIHTIIQTTSPNGPGTLLKGVAKGHRDHAPTDWPKADPEGKFPDLHELENNPLLTQMCAMVSDADLYASAGAGERSNAMTSQTLTSEFRKSGNDVDLTTESAQKFFFDNIVGIDGFSSYAGRAVANDSFMRLRTENENRLSTKSVGSPKP